VVERDFAVHVHADGTARFRYQPSPAATATGPAVSAPTVRGAPIC